MERAFGDRDGDLLGDALASHELDAALGFSFAAHEPLVAVMSSLTDPVLVCRIDLTIVYVNAALQRMVGMTAEALLGRSVADLGTAVRETKGFALLERVRDGVARGRVVDFWPGDGRWYEATIARSTDLLIAICRDVTDQDHSLVELDAVRRQWNLGRYRRPAVAGASGGDTAPRLGAASDAAGSTRTCLHLTSILATSPDALALVSLEGELASWNPGAERIFGWRPAEAIGRSVGVLAGHARPHPLVEACRRGAEGLPTLDAEAACVRADGTPIDVAFTVVPLRDEVDQQVVALSLQLRDMTAHRAQVEELERRATMLDRVRDGVVAIGLRGELLTWNRGAERIFGWSPDDAVGQTLALLQDPDDAASLYRRVIAPLERVDEHEVVVPVRHRSGARRWIQLSLTLLRDAAGAPDRVIAIAVDVTERRAAEDDLRRRERRLRGFVEATARAMWVSDGDGAIVEAPPEGAGAGGASGPAVRGRAWTELLPDPAREHVVPAWTEAARAGTVFRHEVAHAAAGEVNHTAVTMVPLRDPEGAVREWVGVATDVTGERRQAAERERALDGLEKAVRFYDVFVAILGHDLRSPLQAILANLDLVLHSIADGAQATRLQRALASGHRMHRLIDQLLDVTCIRAGGGLGLRRGPCDLEAVVCASLAELRARFRDRVFALTVHGDVHGHWDPDRLGQVAANLLGNAAQHTADPRSITVEIDGRDPATVSLAIANRGAIPPQYLPVLFEPFRTRNVQSHRPVGLGLGLYITREILEAHGGTITVASDDAAGTTFTITLPRDAVASPATDGAGDPARRPFVRRNEQS